MVRTCRVVDVGNDVCEGSVAGRIHDRAATVESNSSDFVAGRRSAVPTAVKCDPGFAALAIEFDVQRRHMSLKH